MITVDDRKFQAALRAISLSAGDLLQIEGAGAYTLVNGMRMRVPVKTSATKNSIMSHITQSTSTMVVDEVGPETIYAPAIEYGISSKTAYPIQPFVRPTAVEDFSKVIKAIGTAFGQLVVSRWK
jgi:hypothetical protein